MSENVEVVRRVLDRFGDSQPEDLTDEALREMFDPEVE